MEKLEELKRLIEYHSDRYYNQDDPEISDFEYDELIKEFRALGGERDNVGGTVKREFREVNHDTPVLSLSDVSSKQEVSDFVEKMQRELEEVEFIVERKIDGLSVVLRYYDGILKEGITRGNGIVGESVYENLLEINSIPKEIPTKLPYLEVRGEVYISYDNFKKVNQRHEKLEKKLFANPRNCAAGTLRQLNPAIVKERNLDIYIFNLEIAEGKNFSTHTETLEWLASQNFVITPDYRTCITYDEVWNAIKNIEYLRWKLPYGIDGAVIKINNLFDREILGSTSKVPRWAIAYKYPPEQKQTIIEDIIVQVGRTGRLTPVAILKPIHLAGTSLSRAVLHNQDFISNKDIRIGDTVVVRKAGDIIPEVVSVIMDKRKENSKPYQIPDNCPICHYETDKEASHTFCTNPKCPAKSIKGIIHFVSKNAMDINSLGANCIEALVNYGYIKEIADIYSLYKYHDELIEKGIVGKKRSTEKMLIAIERSKDNDIDKLISGFGIKNVGKQSARTLATYFKDIDEIKNATYEQLINLPDFGEIITSEIINFFKLPQTISMIEELKVRGVNLTSKTNTLENDNRFSGKIFVLTGALKNITRERTTEIIQSFGGKVSSSVSKKTDYVIAGENAGSKLTKAQTLGTTILSEEDFEMLIV
ncbi:DNA ligase (NAD(+)) LigA [Candidatus Epulonipiscium fishelsonii]|nr:DNA ligase (NAD(+)) LigA [Epulopiscium sp. SCG-C06WGA-EpuloA1]